MSSGELDAFRAELLRQRVIFEGELRRQREFFENRIEVMSRHLADREADCRNLQAVVTVLGKKLDSFVETHSSHRSHSSRRTPIPERSSDDIRRTRVESVGRRPSPVVLTPTTIPNRVTLLKPPSKTNSPRRNVTTPRGYSYNSSHCDTPR